MALLVQGAVNRARQIRANIGKKDHKYKYPVVENSRINWHPDTELHQNTITRLLENGYVSRNAMSGRYPSWKKIDHSQTAFCPPDTENNEVKLVIPTSFSIRESLLTQFVYGLMTDTFFPLEGIGPEDELGAILLERHIQQQMEYTSAELPLHTAVKDGLTYGLGVIAPMYHRKYGNKLVFEDLTADSLLGPTKMGQRRSVERALTWEGHELINVDPYHYLPDPGAPGHNIQKGSFVGWIDTTSRIELLDREHNSDGQFFNAQYLDYAKSRSALMEDNSGRYEATGGTAPSDSHYTEANFPVDVMYMYVKLIPKEWGLPGGDRYPEIWTFAVANDSVIIMGQPLGLAHELFPVVVFAPDFDGYSMAPISRMELLYPSQIRVDKLISSHFSNIDRTLHNTYLIDPFRVNINDAIKMMSSAGGLIRTRRSTWGQGVAGAMEQMKTSDITRGNVVDSQYMMKIMEYVGNGGGGTQGAFDPDAPERRTAKEFSETRDSSMGRTNKTIRMAYAMAMRPLARMLASQTIQLASQASWVKINGGAQQKLIELGYGDLIQRGRVNISPADMNVNYDVQSSFDKVPAHNNPDAILKAMELAGGNPILASRVDFLKLFLTVMYRAGEVNAERFVIQEASPEAIAGMVAGNPEGAIPLA